MTGWPFWHAGAGSGEPVLSLLAEYASGPGAYAYGCADVMYMVALRQCSMPGTLLYFQ